MDTIRVGIIGAAPERSWAATAHIPALRMLPQYRLTAVGTSRPETAAAAAAAFGADHAFTDPRRLAGHPDVDLVVVSVKVPHHFELAEAALDAGKHLLVEWPLALTTAQARDLAGRAVGSRAATGLQARFSPVIQRARELIADGYVGRVTSVNVLVARGKGAAGTLPEYNVYTLDKTNGAGVFEVAGGHTLDALEYVVGQQLTGFATRTSVQRPRYTVAETGATIDATSPDQVLIHAGLTGGAVVSAHIHDAKVTQARTRLEIGGTEGDLVLETMGPHSSRGIQIADLRLTGSRGSGDYQELAADGAEPAVVRNVARQYAALAGDIRAGTAVVPSFAHGVRLHSVLDEIRASEVTRAA